MNRNLKHWWIIWHNVSDIIVIFHVQGHSLQKDSFSSCRLWQYVITYYCVWKGEAAKTKKQNRKSINSREEIDGIIEELLEKC